MSPSASLCVPSCFSCIQLFVTPQTVACYLGRGALTPQLRASPLGRGGDRVCNLIPQSWLLLRYSPKGMAQALYNLQNHM